VTAVAGTRTYGNFKPARRRLIGGLGPAGVAAAAAALAAAFLAVVLAGLLTGLIVGLIGALVVAPLGVEVGGATLADRIVRRTLVSRGRSRGELVYRSGVVSRLPGGNRLPGLLWRTRVADVETGRAGWPALGIVIYPAPQRLFAITLRCDPSGLDLVDQATVDYWVAATGAWLQALGSEPDLVQAQVTVESAPDPGTALARTVADQRHPSAPTLAREVMADVVETYPRAAATTDTRVTLTFAAPRARRPRSGGPVRRVSDEEMCRRIAARLPGLAQTLRATGAGAVVPMSAGDLAAVCRAAYDPVAAAQISRAPRDTVVWADCGPVAATERWDHYLHDSGVSVTWGLAAAPRGVVHDTVLARLMAPDAALRRKRVSIVYRPLSPAATARAVDTDVRDSQFRFAQKGRPTARDIADVTAARATAAEEAAGAGLVLFTLLYTATVASVEDLDLAEDTVRDQSEATRLRLRPLFGSQAAGFAAGLPVGVVLSRMAHIPPS
jgi:hypothetical protein